MHISNGLLGFIVAAKHCQKLILCELYSALDVDGDGLISVHDFFCSFSSLGFNNLQGDDLDTVVSLFKFLDPFRNGFMHEKCWTSMLSTISMVAIPCADYGNDAGDHYLDESECMELTPHASDSDNGLSCFPGRVYLKPTRVDSVSKHDPFRPMQGSVRASGDQQQ
jgi:hypothetical protein